MKKTDKISESTEVSIRLKACCKSAQVETFADLLAIPRSELLKRHNLGRRTMIEIDDIRIDLEDKK